MTRWLHGLFLRFYRRLPTGLRRFVVRRSTPSFSVGSICVIQRDDGAILLVRLLYRARWGFPGGLLKRREHAVEAARREALEETGLDIQVAAAPAVVVAPGPRRVDVVYRCRLSEGCDPDSVRPESPEVVEARWFRPDELPELQHEASQALMALGRGDAQLARHLGLRRDGWHSGPRRTANRGSPIDRRS
ncbi:MAG: NUDIX domain-containing protein [Actinomycetota bacterium]|nr:NUDIX domain-containing protein [Actinomycetota bacterium]